jgi:hypothetical protein
MDYSKKNRKQKKNETREREREREREGEQTSMKRKVGRREGFVSCCCC